MKNHLSGKCNYPTEIHFGAGTLGKLAEHCTMLGIKKPLLVTDSQLSQFDFFKKLTTSLENNSLNHEVFDQVKPNPTGENVAQGVEHLRNYACDGVVALGGGSALDAGKAIALMAHQNLDLFELEDVGDNWKKAKSGLMVPCIAIPTTSGTGSEVGRASVILDEKSQVKRIIFHPSMMPELVIADPELTLGLPAKLTAATGIDAFVHSFEAFCAPGFHPMADGIAVEGMRLVWRWLEVAYNEPTNIEARSQMLVASSMGATAFQKGLGAVHALAHPLGALYDAHHGLLNAILLPYVIQANIALIEDKIQYLCRCFGINECSYNAFLDALLQWRKSLGIPNSLKDIGINADQSARVAKMAVADPSAGGNPISFSESDYERIFKAAVEGRIDLL